jgi:Protein of unknown function (DUF1176)
MSILLLASASLMVAPVPKPASFGYWVAACDNARHCEALALPPEDGSQAEWTLYVSRKAAPSALPRVGADPAFGEWDGEPRPVRLDIDGRQTEFGFDAEGWAVGDPMSLLRAIATARAVTIADLSGKKLGSLPVEGASATLRWLDDRQKRAGTVTAIVARSDRPAISVPSPPALPRIVQPPVSLKPPRYLGDADVKAVLKGTNFCDEEPFEEVKAYRLDAGHTVGIIPCMQHAYQSSYAVVIIDEGGKWRPAPIEQPEPPDEYFEPAYAHLLTAGDYVAKDRLLWMAAKGRGLGDCGSSASWAWDGEIFRLASYHALHECRGAPPGTWFSRWQTANDPLTEE